MSAHVYANVVLDAQARDLKDRLFTYQVPPALSAEAFIGAQVLVPFGHRELVSGYIISLSDTCDPSIAVKEIAEVVVPEALFDQKYVDFLYWLADFYCASLPDVISAAIPAMFSPRRKKVVMLVDRTRGQKDCQSVDPAAKAIIKSLLESKNGCLSMTALKQRCHLRHKVGNVNFYRALNYLRQDGLIKTIDETASAQTPKLITTVLWTGAEPVKPRHRELVSMLSRQGGQMTLKNFIEQGSTTHSTVKKLAEFGILTVDQKETFRDPLAHLIRRENQATALAFSLTEEQKAALAVLSTALKNKLLSNTAGRTESEVVESTRDEPWLLYGVTGSGKTEIYLRLIEETLIAGRTALMLVPEISLTPQLARRLTERFGYKVAIWHSSLSSGEKYDTWRRLRAGDVRVLLGARSAVLANLPDLGLIILDEEHDGSYKQSSPSPRYNAKEVAIERGKRQGALVLLGSATPDVVAYHRASEAGRLLLMPNRVHQRAMPEVTIVDMRQEFQIGNRSIFSRLLEDYLSQCLNRHEQAILLINRRGFASHVFCRACGYVARCRNCSVSLVFHQRQGDYVSGSDEYAGGHLSCHHCGFRCSAIFQCPACQSPFIRQFGLGTQRIEHDINTLFPQARTLRLDSDIANRKGSHEQVLHGFAEGRADILIGTQMVSKGLDIANVTLVGVIAADAAFNVPDYRSTERGFQLLTQVSGRAGRGDQPGSVILQTYNTEMPVLQWAKTHDYQGFVQAELETRKAFGYPPFSQLLRIVIQGADVLSVERECDSLAEELGKHLEDTFAEQDIQVLGPAPCLLEKLRGKYRYHLLVKNFAGQIGRIALTNFLRHKRMPQGLVMAVDVDSLELM